MTSPRQSTAILFWLEYDLEAPRGARKGDAKMMTTAMRGVYVEDRELHRAVLGLLGGSS